MRLALMLWTALWFAAPRLARADAPEIEIARGHSRRGVEHYAASRFAEAAAEFELARKELPLPELDYNLGRCYEGLGDVDAALIAYRRFLASAPPSAERTEVESRARLLEIASPKVRLRIEREHRQAAAARRWHVLRPPAIGVGVVALAAGVASAALYPALLKERDQLALSCPPSCDQGSYSRAKALNVATLATFGIAVGAATVDIVMWGVAGSARRVSR